MAADDLDAAPGGPDLLRGEVARLSAELASSRQREGALERQLGATADVLRTLATPGQDLHATLRALQERAAQLLDAAGAVIYRIDGNVMRRLAPPESGIGATDEGWWERPIDRLTIAGRAILDRRPHHIHDMLDRSEVGELRPDTRAMIERAGVRTLLAVPLLRGDEAIGSLFVFRLEVRPFTQAETALLETFADQAVIAMENARMFEELERRNEQLTETLGQQSATAGILRVIATSPTDLPGVLDATVTTALPLADADVITISQLVDGRLDNIALAQREGMPPEQLDRLAGRHSVYTPATIDRDSMRGRAFLDRQTVEHVQTDWSIPSEYPGFSLAQVFGPSSYAAVPLLRESRSIGILMVQRMRPDQFSRRQIALLETFADQAVIAIENARLFQQLQERTAQLTRSVGELRALGEVGQAVSSSLDLHEVLTTIVANASRLTGADGGVVYELDEDEGLFVLQATHQTPDETVAVLRQTRIRLGENIVGRAGATRAPFAVEDVRTADFLDPAIKASLLRSGRHSVLAVPLLREGRVLGGLVLSRAAPGAFPPAVVALLETFATQSALAIHNARLYAALERQGRALEEASRHKSQFLANMSHELRTPLNAVIGYSEMLQEELEDLGEESLIPDVEKINAAGRHLLGLINDILDLSKIEAGKMELFLEPIDVAGLVRDVATTVGPLIEKNGNRLQVDVAPDVGEMHADATRLRQILFNLLGNAAKFTDHGTIELRVAREAPTPDPIRPTMGPLDPHGPLRGRGEDAGMAPPLPRDAGIPRSGGAPSFVRGEGGRGDEVGLRGSPWGMTFTVSDTGIGMTEDQLARLFEAFAQAEASTARRFGGTGLGLALVRHFSRMMGGDVAVESQPGVGSTFTVHLPTEVASGEARVASPDDAEASLATHDSPLVTRPTVLVVDDDAAARDLLRRHLEAEGVHVVGAAGGEEGLRLARQLRPALVTLDVLMPGMDGWAVLGALKSDPATADIPVVVLTILDDRDLGYALGAADYLTKPIERDRLIAAVRKHVPRQDGADGRAAARRALVVEDDPATREMLRRMLQREGWAVDEAANGRLGLTRVAAAPPDLILLDLMMPELDGFGFVERLRAEPAWRAIPVLVVTAKDLTPEERLKLNGWVEQVLQKGAYSRDELLAEVRALVRASVNHAEPRVNDPR
jgi:signal transduction histidine kinase/CheY-like chemotaxis protein